LGSFLICIRWQRGYGSGRLGNRLVGHEVAIGLLIIVNHRQSPGYRRILLTVVLDAFRQRTVGCSMAISLHMQVLDLLKRHYANGGRARDLPFNYGSGSQYTSIEFGKQCRGAQSSLFFEVAIVLRPGFETPG
jgi:hypothetical protein